MDDKYFKAYKLHPYEVVLIQKMRQAGKGIFEIEVKNKLPVIGDIVVRERIYFRDEAEKKGLIKPVETKS